MMAFPTIVQSKSNGPTAGTTLAVTFDSDTTTGNMLVLCISHSIGFAACMPVITDNKSNFFRPCAFAITNGAIATSIWACQNMTGGATHTITLATTGSLDLSIVAVEVSGSALLRVTGASSARGTSSPVSSGTCVIGASTDLLVGAVAFAANASPAVPSVGSGFTDLFKFNASATVHGASFECKTGLGSNDDADWTYTGTAAAWCAVAVVISAYSEPATSDVWTGVGYGLRNAITGAKRASSITNCSAGNVKDGVAIDDVTGTYTGGGGGGLMRNPSYEGGLVS